MAEEDPTVGGRVPDEAFWQRVMNPDETRREKDKVFWSKKYGREVTDAEVVEINHNLFGLVRLLMKIQARQDAIAAGQQRAIDEEKVRKLRWALRGLSEQVESTRKMIRRWDKSDPQRAALEQALSVLEQEEASKRSELTTELDPRPRATTTTNASEPPSADPLPPSPVSPVRPVRRRSRRS